MPNLRTIGTIAVQLALTALVAFVIGVLTTANSFNDRPSFRSAFHQYRDVPTAEGQRIFEAERDLVARDSRRLAIGIAVLAFLVFNAAIVLARRKLPGVIKEETIGACAAWMIVGAIGFDASLPSHWRVKGKIVWGSYPGNTWDAAVGMTIGLVLGLIPAMGRWWKQRQRTAAPSQ